MSATIQPASEITQYGAGANGGRSCGFEAHGLRVLVTATEPEENETAWDLASALSTSEAMIDQQRDLIGELHGQIRSLKDQIPPTRGAQTLGPGYVRFASPGDPLPYALWLLNNRERGFGEFGVACMDWDDLFRRFNVRVTGHGTDEHGAWWKVEPIARKEGK